jgi:tetratricopeptide (TPR) repeat protein
LGDLFNVEVNPEINLRTSTPSNSGYDLPKLRNILSELPVNEELLRNEWEIQAANARRRYDLVVFPILLSLLDRTGEFFSPTTKVLRFRYFGIYSLLKCEYSQAETYFLTAEKFSIGNTEHQLPFILSELADVFIQQGRHDDATVALMRGLYFAKKQKSAAALAVVYSNISTLAYYRGDLENSLDNARAGLTYAWQVEDLVTESALNNIIACYYMHMRDWENCEDYFAQALKAAQQCGDLIGQAGTHSNQAAAARYKGDLEESLFQSECAVTINRQIRHKSGTASSLDNQAHTLSLLGRLEEALDCAQQALELQRETGDWRGEVVSLTKLAMIYRNQGDNNRALQHLEAARGLAEAMSERISLMKIYTSLGELRLQMGKEDAQQHQLALDYFHKAFELMEQMGDRAILPDSANRLISISLRCGCTICVGEALKAYQRLLDLYEVSNRNTFAQEKVIYERARLVAGMAHCYSLLNQHITALDYYRQVTGSLESLSPRATTYADYGQLYCNAGQTAAIAGSYQEAYDWLEAGIPHLQLGKDYYISLRNQLTNQKDLRRRTTNPFSTPM